MEERREDQGTAEAETAPKRWTLLIAVDLVVPETSALHAVKADVEMLAQTLRFNKFLSGASSLGSTGMVLELSLAQLAEYLGGSHG